MKHLITTFGLGILASVPLMAAPPTKSLSDTTQVHGLGEVVVTGSNQATSRNLLPYTVSIVNSSWRPRVRRNSSRPCRAKCRASLFRRETSSALA